MATPFKMKGHELPGPNQRKDSPVKELGTLATIGLSALAGGIVSGGSSAIAAGSKKRKAKKAAAQEKAAAGIAEAGDMAEAGAGQKQKTSLV